MKYIKYMQLPEGAVFSFGGKFSEGVRVSDHALVKVKLKVRLTAIKRVRTDSRGRYNVQWLEGNNNLRVQTEI